MNPNPEATRARRYLLGETSDEETAAVEQEYFEQPEAIDRIEAAEDDLIEDYLSGDLSASERVRFERAYLSAPHHRVRVETVRHLLARGSRIAPATPQKAHAVSSGRLMHLGPWLAMAASLLIVASISFWMLSRGGGTTNDVADTRPQQPAAAPGGGKPSAPSSAPRIFALTISPVAVRSQSDAPGAVIPAGTDVVAISLERDADPRKLTPRRAAIRTVDGREVWQAAITTESSPTPGTIARLDVPAASIPAGDYLITLYGTDPKGAEKEWTQYFLRVRAR